MSDKFLHIYLSDFSAVRVVCQHCQTVFEVSDAELGATFSTGYCPRCQKLLFHPQHNALGQLSAALTALRASKDVKIEFPVKAE